MRVYIELKRYGDNVYLLVDNLDGFVLNFSLTEGWRIYAATFATTHSGTRRDVLAEELGEEVAKRAMNELLRLTGDAGEATAVIRWDGEHFTRRFL